MGDILFLGGDRRGRNSRRVDDSEKVAIGAWSTERPTSEGWYFWKVGPNPCDPFFWCSYYVESGGGDATLWQNGICVSWPEGGMWREA